MSDEEVPLTGGHATAQVVRVGSTVRKPWTAATPAVVAFMTEMVAHGVDLPAPLGHDDHGRQVIEFVPGRLADQAGPLTLPQLTRVGCLVRAIHDASEGFSPAQPSGWDVLLPAEDADLICHNDLAPWNLVIGHRWVFIDWDGAGPSTRLWDLAYAAQAFTLNDVVTDPDVAAVQLAALVHGYGAGPKLREALPEAMGDRAGAMHAHLLKTHRTGSEPWASMYVNGHGDHWRAATRYVKQHQNVWARALAGSDGGAARPR